MIGVSVIVKGQATVGTITDFDGNFVLDIPTGKGMLEVSYIGYKTQTVTIGKNTQITIKMEPDTQALEEVVVIGYGAVKKRDLTGAVSSVKNEDITLTPATNPMQALQGRVAGLDITQASGQPGEGPKLQLRGTRSFTASGDPMFIIDGMPGDYSTLNPNDIESISLLKDAASAAIYGARATYGVMLVTTKSGQKEQRPTVTYNFSMQWNTPSHRPDIMDAYTLQLAENERTEWTGNSVSDWSMQLLEAKKKWMENPTAENAWIYQQGSTSKFSWVSSMNPFEEVVRDWTPLQKHTASISGGTAKSRYYLSLGYQHQEGMYKINTDKQNRFNGLMSIDSEITKWFKVNAKISYNVSNLDEPYINPQKGPYGLL